MRPSSPYPSSWHRPDKTYHIILAFWCCTQDPGRSGSVFIDQPAHIGENDLMSVSQATGKPYFQRVCIPEPGEAEHGVPSRFGVSDAEGFWTERSLEELAAALTVEDRVLEC